jgi:hypothetical protein
MVVFDHLQPIGYILLCVLIPLHTITFFWFIQRRKVSVDGLNSI